MRLLLLPLFLLLIGTSTLWGIVDKEIVIGSFAAPKQAHYRNLSLEAALEREDDIARIMNDKRFIFDVKYANKRYRSVLTRFIDPQEMQTVFNAVKKVYPDAFIVKSGAIVIPPVKASHTDVPNAPHSKRSTPASIPPAEEIVATVDETAVISSPASSASAASEKSTAASSVADENDDDDIIIIDETEEEETPEAPASEATTVVPPKNEAVEKAETLEPTQTDTDQGGSLLFYGIAAAVLIIGALLFVARRRKRDLKPLRTPEFIEAEEEKIALVQPQEAQTEEAPEATTLEAESEETEPEETTLDIEPDIEEPAEVQESVDEFPAEAAVKAEGPSPRKKRSLRPHTKPITKESLADFAGNRILIAEDNLINQKVISKLLEDSGIEIVMANNGQEALDILAKDPNFNMILMDAHMPIKDGFEATREIRQNILYEPIVVVALSGDVSSDDIRKMREAGMEEQLAKPLRVEALYDVMYQYLDFAEASEAAAPLDTEDGLEISGGDREMYEEILSEFVASYGDAAVLVDAHLRTGDFDKLAALMLDIRGVAGNIGAKPLSDVAAKLREAALSADNAQCEKLQRVFKDELDRLLEAIEAYLRS